MKKPHRIPRFRALFGLPVGSARRTRLASLPPSFLSSSPATVRSAGAGGRAGKKPRGGGGPRGARGPPPGPRATVASKVMDSIKMAGQATARFHADPTQAKRAAPQARRPIRHGRFGGITRVPGAARRGWAASRSPGGKRNAQDQINEPGRRRQPSEARERWKPVGGETPQVARCASTTARSARDAQTMHPAPYDMGP